MIYITGDTHGNQHKWMEQIHPVLKRGDTVIVAGDFGVGFWNSKDRSEEMFFDWIEEQPYHVLFCDGNHCDFDKLNAYPVSQWCGGSVHFLRKNLIHLMRGEIYEMEEQSVFVFGGGYSRDRYLRQEGVSWWAQEMPSEEEYKNAVRNIERYHGKVDVVITHTAPAETVYAMACTQRLGIKNDMTEERSLTAFLDYIQSSLSYERWFFGHFHVDRELWRNQTAVFSAIRQLKTGEVVRRWQPYEA